MAAVVRCCRCANGTKLRHQIAIALVKSKMASGYNRNVARLQTDNHS